MLQDLHIIHPTSLHHPGQQQAQLSTQYMSLHQVHTMSDMYSFWPLWTFFLTLSCMLAYYILEYQLKWRCTHQWIFQQTVMIDKCFKFSYTLPACNGSMYNIWICLHWKCCFITFDIFASSMVEVNIQTTYMACHCRPGRWRQPRCARNMWDITKSLIEQCSQCMLLWSKLHLMLQSSSVHSKFTDRLWGKKWSPLNENGR